MTASTYVRFLKSKYRGYLLRFFHSQVILIPPQFTESQCGCTFRELAVCMNVIYVCICPCTLCFWRSRLRRIRSLEVPCRHLSTPSSDTITLRDHALETCSRRCAAVLVQYASKPERSDCGEQDDAKHDNRFNT